MRRYFFAALCTMALAACGGGGAAPLTSEAAGGLSSLTVSHPEGAVTVGDTLIMQAEARDAAGQVMADLKPQWASSDISVAAVDGTGVVRGIKAGAATITASATAGGVTKTADYAVAVLAAPAPPTPPAPPTQPAPPSTPGTAEVQGVEDAFRPNAVTIQAGGTVTWRMVDEEHDVAWSGAAPTGGNIGKMDRGTSVSRTFPNAGTYTYTCQRHKERHGGTVTVTAGGTPAPPPPSTPPSTPAPAPSTATVTTPGTSFSPAAVTIAAGGTVTWQFTGSARHNVTFNGTAPAGGSIPDAQPGTSVSRTFTTAGSYAYECTRHSGMTGQVIVQP